MQTIAEVISTLQDRAANHDIEVRDILEMIPPQVLDSREETMALLEEKHLSHIYPKSTFPGLANDPSNIVLEDGDVNMKRGAEVMTDAEIQTAEVDLQADATRIDTTYTSDYDPEWVEAVDIILNEEPDIFMDLDPDIFVPETFGFGPGMM
jgi:hypothetical protein